MAGERYSPDGRFGWDGTQWVPVTTQRSEDGKWWWDGAQWQPVPAEPMPAPDTAALATAMGPTPTSTAARPKKGLGSLFGGKHELEEKVIQLQSELDALGATERSQLRQQIVVLRAEVLRLQQERANLAGEVAARREQALAQLQQELGSVRSKDKEKLQRAIDDMQKHLAQLQAQKAALETQIVETNEQVILQEVGIYQYRHPLADAIAYKARLVGLQARIKDMAKAGSAVQGTTNWSINNSAAAGAKMVREFSKLMLRAYNNEAEAAVSGMKPYTLDSSIARLVKARETIVKLGGTMNIRVTDAYHKLRVEELELTADYLAKVAEEKEREREDKIRLREEEVARREIAREQERLRKEQAHHEALLAAMRQQGNLVEVAAAEAKLVEISDAIDGLTKRAANIKAGYLYVISNVGAFGPNMVKVGLTRRIDPDDRVRELGGASVPFRFDTHAMFFSEDAVGLETHVHHALSTKRVNMVNARREFFFATPAEVKALLEQLKVPMLAYVDAPVALEWRQSEVARKSDGLNLLDYTPGPSAIEEDLDEETLRMPNSPNATTATRE